MATYTYASINLTVNAQDYIFSVDAEDGVSTEMVNLVSGQGIGDTFSSSAIISNAGSVVLNSRDSTGASKSVLGAVLVDPNNNIVFQIGYVDPETATIPLAVSSNYRVGLNYKLTITTTNA